MPRRSGPSEISCRGTRSPSSGRRRALEHPRALLLMRMASNWTTWTRASTWCKHERRDPPCSSDRQPTVPDACWHLHVRLVPSRRALRDSDRAGCTMPGGGSERAGAAACLRSGQSLSEREGWSVVQGLQPQCTPMQRNPPRSLRHLLNACAPNWQPSSASPSLILTSGTRSVTCDAPFQRYCNNNFRNAEAWGGALSGRPRNPITVTRMQSYGCSAGKFAA